jgi:ribonuclease D
MNTENISSKSLLASGFPAQISAEDIALLPESHYEGPICWVSTDEDLSRARDDLLSESVIGFDTETRPAFKKGEFYLPCLAQLASAKAVYLFSLRRPEFFPLLKQILESEHCAIAGIALADDFRTLNQVFPFADTQVLDLGLVARRNGFKQTGLRNLAALLLGYRISKSARTSNWEAEVLSPAQRLYAATDAWVCRQLMLRMQEHHFLALKPSTTSLLVAKENVAKS